MEEKIKIYTHTTGFIMIFHFVFNSGWSFYTGTLEDIFWISHFGTFIGGVGVVFMNQRLVSVALVCLFVHHGFWLIDTLPWVIAGTFPFGTTAYLKNADIMAWFKTSNHFFTVPFLLINAYFLKGIKKGSWMWCAGLFTILIIMSYIFLPPEANVNCAHGLWPGMEKLFFVGSIANLKPLLYLVSIIALNVLFNHFPSYIVLRTVYKFFLKNKNG